MNDTNDGDFGRPFNNYAFASADPLAMGFYLPYDARISELRCVSALGNVGGDRPYTVQLEGVNQALTATIANGTAIANDLDPAHDFDGLASQRVNLLLGATIGVGEIIYVSVRLTPTPP